ncbi:MAG: Transcription factor Pcc1 [Methanosaeta sp. PtaB.Bin039]|nr:MAG: Transcription factor Pcc1 [Methanosaeta sp. PtaB.Bin039]OPY44682.1 MAG: Transcription factor Pcc1 [Methanosaeta sp. PtaU1.Bin028]
MKGRAELRFPADDACRLAMALWPELDDDLHRGSVQLDQAGDALRLTICADDVVSLRAALNTWLRLTKIALEMEKV